MSLMDMLPRYYESSAVASNIMAREDGVFDQLDSAVADVLDQYFIDTATWGLAYWERVCEIPTDETKTYAQRRSVVKSRLRGVGTVTIGLIKSVAEAYDNGTVSVTDYNKNMIPAFDVSPWSIFNKATMMSNYVNRGQTGLTNYVNRGQTGITNFVGKVAGSTTESPNVAKLTRNSVLQAPNGTWEFEFNVNTYNYISAIGGNVAVNTSNLVNTQMAQQLFSFDLIAYIERKHGVSIGATLAEKVAWVKANFTSLTFKWYGFGSSPTGNKATVSMWDGVSAWIAQGSHSSAGVLLLSYTFNSGNINARLDANGFVHFLAYADASNGTIASAINTDYVELSVDYLAPFLNPNISKEIGNQSTLQAPTGTWVETSRTFYNNISVLDGALSVRNSVSSGNISQHLFSFDLISFIERKHGISIGADLAAKVAWLKANLTLLKFDWYGWGSSKTGYKAYQKLWRVSDSSWIGSGNHTLSSVSKLTYSEPTLTDKIDSNGFVHYLAYADAATAADNPTVAPTLSASGSGSGLAAGTYYVTYTWATGVGQTLVSPQQSITITAGQNINVTVPAVPFGAAYALIYIGTATGTGNQQGNTTTTYTQNTVLNTGSTSISGLTVNGAIVSSSINTDYVELSVDYLAPFLNSNVAKRTSGSGSSTLLAPSSGSWIELVGDSTGSVGYPKVSVLDGQLGIANTSTNATTSQHLFSFDLISIIERKYNTTIPGANLAAKVTWLKANVTKLTANWHGWGSSKAGYKATFGRWNVVGNGWINSTNHTSGTVTKLTVTPTGAALTEGIDSNGFFHFNAYADAAAAVDNPTVAPTLSASGSGSGLAAGTYYISYGWITSNGETLNTADQSITITTGQNITVTVPTFPFGVTAARIYLSQTLNDSNPVFGSTTTTTYIRTTALGSTLPRNATNTAIVPSVINTDYVELIVEANVVASVTKSDAQIDPLDSYKLTLNAEIATEVTSFPFVVIPGRTYTLSGVLTNSDGRARIKRDSPTGGTVATISDATTYTTFTAPSDVNTLYLTVFNNAGVGSYTFANLMIQEGTYVAPTFEPKRLYTVGIKFVSNHGIPDNLVDIEKALRDIIPAHLLIDFSFNFMTWESLNGKNLTWGTLQTINYTWKQFESL
jgi:uncharacterized protein YmfQ (DUF2313 family)